MNKTNRICCICGKGYEKDLDHYKRLIVEERKLRDNPIHKYDTKVVSTKYLDICDKCLERLGINDGSLQTL